MNIFLALGASGNTRLYIRRKRDYETLLNVSVDDAIAENQPTEFVIEITTGLKIYCANVLIK